MLRTVFLPTLRKRVTPAPRRRFRYRPPVWLAAVVVLIGLNLALSPVDPLMENAGLGGAYTLSYNPTAGYSQIEQLVAIVPHGAAIIASDDLFPFVANDLNAYSLHWDADPSLQLPFNASNRPPFVLISADRLSAVPAWLSAALYNFDEYGLRAAAWDTPAGAVQLFESDYFGSPLMLGNTPSENVSIPASQFTPGEVGYLGADSASPTGSSVISVNGELGLLAQIPLPELGPGSYWFTFYFHTWSEYPTEPAPNATAPALTLNAGQFGLPYSFGGNLQFGDFSGTSDAPKALAVGESGICFDGVIRIYTVSPQIGVSIGEMTITSLD